MPSINGGIAAVSTGYGYTVALNTDGSLVALGLNDHGQLGDSTTTNSLNPVPVSGGLNLGASSLIPPIANDTVFAYAEANYPNLFPGTATDNQFLQYNYRHYSNGNYLGIDTVGGLYILGPYTNNVLTPVGKVADFTSAILAWETKK